MQQQDVDLNQIHQEFKEFHTHFQSLLMASINAEDRADCSYAPYVEHQGSFYIYISELATHTRNLMQHPDVSVLFIEDESSATTVFARRRATYRCEASEIERGCDAFELLLDRFADRFGPLINKTLRQLPDFHLFRLKPTTATYVQGFAGAFEIDGEDLSRIRHLGA